MFAPPHAGQVHGPDAAGAGCVCGVSRSAAAVLILPLELAPVLVHVQTAAGELGVIENIGILRRQIPRPRHGEPAVRVVKEHAPLLAQLLRDPELRRFLPILLAIGKLSLDLVHRGVPPLRKPRREPSRAGFAAVAVLQLTVAEQPDLFAADIAVFLIKKSHCYLLSEAGCVRYASSRRKASSASAPPAA